MALVELDKPARLDFEITTGQHWEYPIIVEDFDDNPIDLTGCQISMSVRERQDKTSPKITDFEIQPTALELSAGKIKPTLYGAQSSKIWQGEGWYDLKIRAASGKVFYYMNGKIKFIKNVTV